MNILSWGPVKTCHPLPSLCALSLPIFELGVCGTGSNCGREGLSWQQQELLLSGTRVWTVQETHGLDLLQMLGEGIPLPAQTYLVQGCARRPQR